MKIKKLKIKKIIVALCILASFSSCGKVLMPSGLPECIREEIKKIQSEPIRNPAGSIWQYEYTGKTVYFIPAYCCDFPSRLLDSNCQLICHPDGGFTGKGDGRCSDFFSTRKNEKLIWKDGRK
jgi:hypothetical protein